MFFHWRTYFLKVLSECKKKKIGEFFFRVPTEHERPLVLRRKHVDNRASFPYQATATLLEKRFLQREHRGLFLIGENFKFISDSNFIWWGVLPDWHAFCRYAIWLVCEKWAVGLNGCETLVEAFARTESIYEGRWSPKEANSRVNRNLSVSSICVRTGCRESKGTVLKLNFRSRGLWGASPETSRSFGDRPASAAPGVVPTMKATGTLRSRAAVQAIRRSSERVRSEKRRWSWVKLLKGRLLVSLPRKRGAG